MKKWIFKIIFITIVLVLLVLSLLDFSKNLSAYKKIKDNYLYNTHYLDNLSYFKKRLGQVEMEIKNAPKKIISSLTPIMLLNHCSEFAGKLNVDIISYNPANKLSKNETEFKEVSIEIHVKTDYLNLIKFINKIENLNSITKIDKLEIYRIEPYSSGIKSKIILTGYTINEK